MIKFSPLPSAPSEYSAESESIFRRSVENALLNVYSGLESAVSAQSGEASPASKRETLLLQRPLGLKVSSQYGIPLDVTNSATPVVQGLSELVIANSGAPLVITDLLGGVPGQSVTIFSAQVVGLTINDGFGSPGGIHLSGGANLVFPVTLQGFYSNVTLIKREDTWYETSRGILN
tara:strand:- start:81 stop:608 length:528 start_codon:yes stop_codon:yes gene_type:complete